MGDGRDKTGADGHAAGQQDVSSESPSLLEQIRTNPAMYKRYKAHRARMAARKDTAATSHAASAESSDSHASTDEAESASQAKPHGQGSEADWIHYLTDLHRYLLDQTGAEKQQLLDMRRLRAEQSVVGSVSESVASVKAHEKVKLPDEGIWDQVFEHLNKAHSMFAEDNPYIDGAKQELAIAVKLFHDAHRQQYEYRSRVEGGAETATSILRGVEVACDITLTVLSAGVGGASANVLKLGARGVFKLAAEQAAKSGLAKTALKAAVVGGLNRLAQGSAQEGSASALGVESEFDVGKVIREAGEAAVMNLLGVLVGGALSKAFMRSLGGVLGSRMSPNAIAALAEKYGIARGAIPAELFVTRGWRFLVGVAGDVCTTVLQTSLSVVVERLRSGGKGPSSEQFVSMVIEQLIQNGLLQVVLGAVTHERANAGTAERQTSVHDKSSEEPRREPPITSANQAASSTTKTVESNTTQSTIKEDAKGSAEPQQARSKGRVEEPVPGLMASIDPLSTPDGWTIKDSYPKPRRETPHLIEVRTDVVDPQGREGFVHRGYDTEKKQFVMLNAFLIKPGESPSSGVQRMIQHSDPVMIENKGTPTQTFLTLRQIKLLEQKAGMNMATLTKVKMSTIQNIEALLQLESLRRKGLSPSEAVMQTHSKQYAESTLIQAGKRIVSGKVVGGVETPIGDLLKHYENGQTNRRENFAKLLEQYGIARTDKVLWDYNIEFEVADFSAGGE